MNSSPPPFDIPKRLSLPAQAAASIRKAISERVWDEYLPGERRLCEMFQISRPTVRTALCQLAKEGLIEIRHGLRNRLLTAPEHFTPQPSRLVVLVTHEPVSHIAQMAYQGIGDMRTHLAEHGFATEVLVCQSRSPLTQQRKLDSFIRENRVFCCVLLSVSRELQQWFARQSLPALVLGSCHPDVVLPSLDVDYRSVCRHAAGIFLQKGHRRIALIVPNSGVAGDIASEKGFQEAVAGRGDRKDAEAIIVRHNGTALNISAKLDALFKSNRPPTALLVAKHRHVFAVIIYLLKRGLSVPDKISLIARDHEYLFETVHPTISHYQFKDDSLGQRLSRLMIKLLNQGSIPAEPNLLFPKFFEGKTVRSHVDG
ncbi:substrate-binding domain-containing protein [Oleiharenicola lentus]|uniref:substrate-binding domain-containing protein n=1 Tax=Oleiharenicola lentus TaxID=2508720 RepID=UPI003F679C8F